MAGGLRITQSHALNHAEYTVIQVAVYLFIALQGTGYADGLPIMLAQPYAFTGPV